MAAERIESQVPMVQRRTLTITPTLDLYAVIKQNVLNVIYGIGFKATRVRLT